MFPADSRILIVDDSSFARNILVSALREMKYTLLYEADSAQQAKQIMIQAAQERHPIHLLISDLYMPETNGLQLLQWVRGSELMKDMPTIVLTSSKSTAEVLEAGKLGVSTYIIKPIEEKVLKEKLLGTWQKHGEKYLKYITEKLG